MVWIAILWRIYFVGAAILLLNAFATVIFDNKKDKGKHFILSLPFILIWPLSIFSRGGRKLILKRVKKL